MTLLNLFTFAYFIIITKNNGNCNTINQIITYFLTADGFCYKI